MSPKLMVPPPDQVITICVSSFMTVGFPPMEIWKHVNNIMDLIKAQVQMCLAQGRLVTTPCTLICIWTN